MESTLSLDSATTAPSLRVSARARDVATALLRPLACVGFAAGIITTRADPDLWGHIRFGLDILNSGHVAATVDPYTFTQGRPFLYHEWLGGTVMAAAYRAGGVAGLVILKACLVAAIVGTVWHTLKRIRFGWRWAGLVVVAWGTLPLVSTLRPQLWTALLIPIVCRVLLSRSARLVWVLPPLFALWANLHGGWIVGGGLVALWTGAAFVQRTTARWHLLAVGALSLVATLLNPYGWNLWVFLAETIRLGRDHIAEWQPVWTGGASMLVLWGGALALLLVSLRRFGRPTPVVLCALAGLALAGARVSRLEPLFALATVMLLAPQWPTAGSNEVRQPTLRALLDAGAVIATIGVALGVQVLPHCITSAYTTAPDTAAAESLRTARGRLVTSFNWGEYVIWHFGPALKVSIDGRRETLYSDRTVTEQLGIEFNDPAGIAALARITPDYVWLPVGARAAADWLHQHGYREDVRTAQSFIAVRDDLPPLQAWRGSPTSCFPGP